MVLTFCVLEPRLTSKKLASVVHNLLTADSRAKTSYIDEKTGKEVYFPVYSNIISNQLVKTLIF
jgi:hypothetical protein